MTCLRNTCPDFRFHLKTKNRFTLEIKLHTPTVKLRLISFGVKHGHHKHTSCIRETRIKNNLAYVLGPNENSPNRIWAQHTHTHTEVSIFTQSVGTTGGLHSAHASPVKGLGRGRENDGNEVVYTGFTRSRNESEPDT